ncbi:Sm Like Protein [Chondrus crispus]|uniref:U6 snRNA-associated Sm-like protein LSm4 n=1 Tax=Chondrus crispus TaxID=2769 RepID=R7QHR4_CHOCR|nr:Sm Like Protein [Chondrus crispus]CDF36960.1 Sm Like Protein [Chondrus crispus]|eukprot:XP_005716779.1 Sm Like Protein [Chondrus crispus]
MPKKFDYSLNFVLIILNFPSVPAQPTLIPSHPFTSLHIPAPSVSSLRPTPPHPRHTLTHCSPRHLLHNTRAHPLSAMLPLSLLKSSTGYPILVELKNGDTYNGHLSNIDQWMNVNLNDVIRTSKDGDHFWSVPEMYIRGNTIKYLRVPDAVLDAVADEKHARDATVRCIHPLILHPRIHPVFCP